MTSSVSMMKPVDRDITYERSDARHGAPVSDAAIAAGVESEDMDASGILGAVLAVASLVVVIVIAVFQIVNLEVQDVRHDIAAAATGSGQLQDLQLSAIQKLNRYEPLGTPDGVYRIPIDRAMQLMAQEASRTSSASYTKEVVLLHE